MAMQKPWKAANQLPLHCRPPQQDPSVCCFPMISSVCSDDILAQVPHSVRIISQQTHFLIWNVHSPASHLHLQTKTSRSDGHWPSFRLHLRANLHWQTTFGPRLHVQTHSFIFVSASYAQGASQIHTHSPVSVRWHTHSHTFDSENNPKFINFSSFFTKFTTWRMTQGQSWSELTGCCKFRHDWIPSDPFEIS